MIGVLLPPLLLIGGVGAILSASVAGQLLTERAAARRRPRPALRYAPRPTSIPTLVDSPGQNP